MTHNLKILTWKQVRKDIKSVDAQLASIIDALNPTDEYKIYKLDYPWGQHLLKEGVLYLPNKDNKWVRLDDTSIDKKVAEDLSYNISMPLGVVLKNSIELYMEALGRVIPFVYMPQSTIFGLWVGLDKFAANYTGKTSNIVAGARSAMLLPKISDAIGFKKLKKAFGLQCKMPETLTDQWPVFAELARHQAFPEEWTATVIYFGKKWLELKKDIEWKMFRYYLLETAWAKTNYLRNQIVSDLAFSCALEEKNLKPNPYVTDTIKHLTTIWQDGYPAYEVATTNLVLPLKSLQDIFVDIYGLKYQPTFLVPGYLNSSSAKSLYYSLEVPTLMSFSPKSKKNINKLEDLREIKHIVQRITDYLQEDKLGLKYTPLFKLIDGNTFEYYHTDDDEYHEISKTSLLQKIDQNIVQECKKYDKPFCDTSPFLRGCIRISIKK
ncbi:MAG: hypothetical protein K0R14_1211 [Burkholderiales bacterium]|jgi:hypothetical protein|nr:hypothetical protein [Burkholderiales bacterium]